MKIVVEYSKEQNAFHRSTDIERSYNEKRLIQTGKASTFKVIGEFVNYDMADEFINKNYLLIKTCGLYTDKEGKIFAI